jgi:hypothetical protein
MRKLDEIFERHLHNDEAKRATFAEMLEVGRDVYEMKHGRRVQLVEPSDVDYFATQDEFAQTRTLAHVPMDEFVGGVFMLANSKTIDHATFESMRYFGGYGDTDKEYLKAYIGKYQDEREVFEAIGSLPVHENCPARSHINYKFFSVYDQAVSISRGNSGECWLTTRVLADWIEGLTRQQASAAIKWLTEKGWLIELSAPTNRKGGKYRVIEHDEWTATHGDGACRRDKRKKVRG